MKYTPVLVGAGVGVLHSAVVIQAQKSRAADPNSKLALYAPGLVKFGVLGGAMLAEVFGKGTANVNYGAATAAATLIGANIPNAIQASSVKRVFTYTGTAAPARAHAHTTGGTCTGCGHGATALVAPLRAPVQG